MTLEVPETLDLFPAPARPSWAEFTGGVRAGTHPMAGSGDIRTASAVGRGLPCGRSGFPADRDPYWRASRAGRIEALPRTSYQRGGGRLYSTAQTGRSCRQPVPSCVVLARFVGFRVCPINDLARQHFDDPEDFTERAYVQRLYRLRRLTLTRSLSDSLLDMLPPVERRTMTK
jgi:hypothetical protein